MNIGQRGFTLAELDQIIEDFDGPEWQRRNLEAIRDREWQKWVDLPRQSYEATSTRASKEAEDITRVAVKLHDAVEEIKQDLIDGRLTPTQAAKELAGVSRDLNVLRTQSASADDLEAKSWESVDCDADEYQERIMRRFPPLASRVRIVLDEDEVNQRPQRRRGRPADAPDESDLRGAGYPSDRLRS